MGFPSGVFQPRARALQKKTASPGDSMEASTEVMGVHRAWLG